jgi:hypothetical protein
MARADHASWRGAAFLRISTHAPDLVQHVVFRLADSLPAWLRNEIAGCSATARTQAIDAALDRRDGRHELAVPEIGEVMQNALLRFRWRAVRADRLARACPTTCTFSPRSVPATDQIALSIRGSRSPPAANGLLRRTGSFCDPNISIATCGTTAI